MAEKVLNTRIQLKYDTYANWHEKNTVLKKGEIAIVEIAATQGAVSQVPAIMMKVGNGTSTFDQLPWSKALSADVYDWAKAATKPEYDASEIKNLSTYISGQIKDTDTQYKLEQDASDGHILKFYTKSKDGDWGTPTTITIPDDTGVQSNWAQNDESAKDYVRNRTHWVADDGTVHQIDERYLPQATADDALVDLAEIITPAAYQDTIYLSPAGEIYTI